MLREPEFFPAKSRLLVGVLLLFVAPALTLGQWYATKGPLETLAWFEQHRSPGDSVAYASALYHGTHARATQANRWRPTGYVTLGLVATIVAVGLLLSSRHRRTA